MPKCNICNEIFHPDYLYDEIFRGDNIKMCAFCKADKTKLTITNKDGTIDRIVDRKEESTKYKIFLRSLSQKEEIAKILNKKK